MSDAAAAATPTAEPDNRLMYWIIAAVLLVLLVVGLIVYDQAKDNADAQAKATQLEQKFRAAGLPVPAETDQIVNALGTDGGAVCDNPASGFGKALLFDSLTNGGSHVGRRPVIVPRRVLQGEALILQVYCPDKLAAYQDKINQLKTDNTIKP